MTLGTPLLLPRPCLMVVTDRRLCGGMTALVDAVGRAVDGGANAVQVREKDLPPPEQAALVRAIADRCGGRATILLNGAPAVALGAGADGVHLAEDALPVADVRRAVHGRLLVGRSVHALDGAIRAEADGADYLVLGTIFPSRSHPGGEAGGVERVRAVCGVVRCPVVAIGGITAENAGPAVGAGAAGVAVISSVLGAPDPRTAATDLLQAMQDALATVSAGAAAAR